MPKLKTNRGAAKRFKLTGGGNFKRGHSHKSHILTKKPPKRIRHLRSPDLVDKADAPAVRKMLPYV